MKDVNETIQDTDKEIEEIADTDGKVSEDKQSSREKKIRMILREILNNSLFLLAVFVITLLLVRYVGQRTVVVGSSMEHTLQDEDNLIVDKITYRFREPERFDIIVFPFSYADETYYIKRIIALPGETVRIDYDGVIYINEEPLLENFGAETIEDPGTAVNSIQLGPDEFFVLGDNRNHSSDSRVAQVGLIKKKDIIGRAVCRIYPFDKISSLVPEKDNE